MGLLPPDQKRHISPKVVPSITEHRVMSPVSTGHILAEGAAIFTDMTETVLTTWDQQMALSSEAQKPEGSLTDNVLTPGQIVSSNMGEFKTRSQTVNEAKDIYPDLYPPVAENYKISDRFYGYMDSMSTDNNPMVLVELTGLSYMYGTTIYVVDRVNGTMYGRFSMGYRVINKRATMRPQFRPTSLEDEYVSMQPTYANTLPGTTSMVTPLDKSIPITQSLQMPTISAVLPRVRDILEPTSNEQVRSTYLERQMKQMDSVKLPSGMLSLQDRMIPRPEHLQDQIQSFCQERKDKRKQEWETHRVALEKMKERKEQQYHQQSQEERDAMYTQMLQNLERTRTAVGSSISKASTIFDEECQLALMEDDFLAIQWKMDRIDQKLADLYGSWQAEYRNAVTSEEYEEIKRFYKPYLEKYESKYRILYQMLLQANKQMGQAGLLSIQEPTSKITPSLAALDDAQILRRKEWKRGEPGEDMPR